jgi:3-oxoacyl-[acyl-carrier-protein] synthase-3
MPGATIQNVRIAGISACVPKHTEENADFPLLSPEERRRVIESTGIARRHIVSNEQCTSDLCFSAAEALLEELQWSRDSVEAVLLVTQTPDYTLPATAVLLQDRLRLPRTTLALDINLGCSGYVYGLQVLASLLSAGGLKRGLLLVGDTSSKIISARDRSVATLFGDAGSASAVEFVAGTGAMHFDFGSDGSGFEAIMITHGGQRNPVNEQSLAPVDYGEGVERNKCQLLLDGMEVFNFSIREVPKTVRQAMAMAGKTIGDIDALVLHQANRFMNELIRKKMQLPAEKVPYSLAEFGNTSSASIPLTIVSGLRERMTTSAMSLVLCGFGVGLSWATVCVNTENIVCPPVIELV